MSYVEIATLEAGTPGLERREVDRLAQRRRGRLLWVRAYGPNYERLAARKRAYDPDDVFRSNQNIRPAVQAA